MEKEPNSGPSLNSCQSRGPYLVPGPYQAKKYCHTPNFLTTISRDPTKQHINLPYTKYLHLTRV